MQREDARLPQSIYTAAGRAALRRRPLKLPAATRTLPSVPQIALKLFLAILLVLNGLGIAVPAVATAQDLPHKAQHTHCQQAAGHATADKHASESGNSSSKHPCGCCHHGVCLCGCSSPADVATIEWRPAEHVFAAERVRLAQRHVPAAPSGVLLRPPIA